VALFEDADLVAHDFRVLGRGHAELLVPMIATLPDRGKAARILVALGPGSFTGVRIGIATARALAIAWGSEVLGYPTLALVAAIALADEMANAVTVCMRGGHGEWFVADYSADLEVMAPTASLAPTAAAVRGARELIVGSAATGLVDLLAPGHRAVEMLPDAARVGLLPEFCFSPQVAPIYGRGPDARLPG